ncbi:MAG: hypothetical protein RIB59_16385 [Rhodospirillales bacterium]
MLDFLSRNIRLLGFVAIAVSLIAWGIDLSGLVYECVYCRAQRTAIGIAGILMILPDPRRWWIRYAAAAICFFGASVAADQVFLVVRAIDAGRAFGMLNLVMAAGALFALVGQALIVFTPKPLE